MGVCGEKSDKVRHENKTCLFMGERVYFGDGARMIRALTEKLGGSRPPSSVSPTDQRADKGRIAVTRRESFGDSCQGSLAFAGT
jgi:hypothetical protein